MLRSWQIFHRQQQKASSKNILHENKKQKKCDLTRSSASINIIFGGWSAADAADSKANTSTNQTIGDWNQKL